MQLYAFGKNPSVAREWGERRSAMVKMTRVASVTTLGILALGLWVIAPSVARALEVSDKGAAVLYWPKIVVNSTAGIDTLIRLSNTTTGSSGPMKQAHCYYINSDGCTAIDFDIILTRDQPLAWHAGTGLGDVNHPIPMTATGTCATLPTRACTQANASQVCPNGVCNTKQSNAGTRIPPVPSDPFYGTLECIEFTLATGSSPAVPDQTGTTNTLIGEATIETVGEDGDPVAPTVDLATYNAIGLEFLAEQPVPANQLMLDGLQYESCPTTLILDHLFDHPEPSSGGGGLASFTDLTLVPCGNNFALNLPGSATAQFVVFNEFEQRFSTTKSVRCFLETQLSLLDTNTPSRSIFSYNVAGTIAGQTRIRPVGSAPTGRGLLGVAIFNTEIGTAAYNLHQSGSPEPGEGVPDSITFP